MQYKRINDIDICRESERICELLNLTYSGKKVFTEEYLTWKYIQSPAGKGYGYACYDRDVLVGLRLIFRTFCISEGIAIDVHQPCDSAVHPEFQGKGIFGFLNELFLTDARSMTGSAHLTFNFPNENSINSYLRLGWEVFRRHRWRTLANLPLNRTHHSVFLEADTWCERNMHLPTEFFVWRFKNKPDRHYLFVQSQRDTFLIFSAERTFGFKVARLVYCSSETLNQNEVNDIRRLLSSSGFYLLSVLETGSGSSSAFTTNALSFARNSSLNMVFNPSLSNVSPPKDVQPFLTDHF